MPNQTYRRYWVVIPGLNEEKYIAQVLKKVKKITSNIIVVDDGSTDSFAKLAKKYTNHVLSHPVNLGKGAALKTGCEYAFNTLNAQAVLFLDSDDQHDPNEIVTFFKSFSRGNDVVFGMRSFDGTMPIFRVVFNRLASVLINILFGSYIPDIPCGYKGLTKSAYQKLAWNASDYSVEMELAARVAKLKVPFALIPIKTIYHDLDRGMTALDAAKMIVQVLAWRISL